MSNIETVTLNGAGLKVEGLGGQNTIIINRGPANLYASAYADAVQDGDNVALILPSGAMNLHGTNGTVYLLGTGKVQLQLGVGVRANAKAVLLDEYPECYAARG